MNSTSGIRLADLSILDSFYHAVKSGDVDRISSILDGNPDIIDLVEDASLRAHALFSATVYNNLDVVEVLLSRGAEINQVEDCNGWTALMGAVLTRNHHICKLLLQQGADVTIKNRIGLTAADYVDRGRDAKLKKIFKDEQKWRNRRDIMYLRSEFSCRNLLYVLPNEVSRICATFL